MQVPKACLCDLRTKPAEELHQIDLAPAKKFRVEKRTLCWDGGLEEMVAVMKADLMVLETAEPVVSLGPGLVVVFSSQKI